MAITGLTSAEHFCVSGDASDEDDDEGDDDDADVGLGAAAAVLASGCDDSPSSALPGTIAATGSMPPLSGGCGWTASFCFLALAAHLACEWSTKHMKPGPYKFL